MAGKKAGPSNVFQGEADSHALKEHQRLVKIEAESSSTEQLFTDLDFTGSNITSIVNRSHQNLQSLQGGTGSEYYHLTLTEHTALQAETDKRYSLLIS